MDFERIIFHQWIEIDSVAFVMQSKVDAES